MSEERFAELREQAGRLWDLVKLGHLASWDQQTVMPERGAEVRAYQLATVTKLVHELLVSDELGGLLDDLAPYEQSHEYDSDAASLIRVLRRDREKELRVPAELREAMSRLWVEAFPVWVEARRTSDFELSLPYLERTLELSREYADCFDVDEPYDALLDDCEPGMKTTEVRGVFARLKEGLLPLVAEAQHVDDSMLRGHFPVEAQKELEQVFLGCFGFRKGSWRLDPTEHPFQASLGTSDLRITTNYSEDEFSVFATLHEGGHGLYDHNIDPALERTPLCDGASAAFHESQSRMFENLVGRSLSFWRWGYPHLRRLFAAQFGGVRLEDFHRAINAARPSLIRVDADEVTYNLHIILRFELEEDLLAGSVDLRDLPSIWNARMKEYLAIEVPDDARGVLQDVHWWTGMPGYFPTYTLGNVISVQLWEKVLEDVPDLEQHLAEGDLEPLTGWLRDRLWRHGRKFTPQEALERIVGGGLDPEPYLRYLDAKLEALAV